MAAATGMPLTLDRIPVGNKVDTVGEPLATSITHLLIMMADDDPHVRSAASHAYGFEPRTVAEFLGEMFQGAPVTGESV